MMKGMILDDNMSNLTCASNEVSISSSNRNEISTMYPQQSFASPNQPPPKKRRNLPGNPDPDAEVIALSPTSLMATNRFVCEICNKGFQRDQNLQLHRRGHNLPWKLKQRTSKEVKKKVYVCPEPTCVHHDPSRALGDLTGIKKHFSRKHGEKKWKCEKCSKRYAVQSDWKAHSKICGTREYRCDCGILFSRRDSFITHRAFCDALAEESARTITEANPLLSSQPATTSTVPHLNLQTQLHNYGLQAFPLKREQQNFNPRPDINPPWLACPPIDLSSQLFSSRLDQSFIHQENPNPSPSPSPSPNPTLPSFQPTASPHMSATALLQKAAQMGVTISKPACPSEAMLMIRPHQTHMSGVSATASLATSAGSGFVHGCLASLGNKAAAVTSGCMEQVIGATVGAGAPPSLLLHDMMMSSLSSTSTSTTGFEGSSFEDALNGMLNPKPATDHQAHLNKSSNEGGGNDRLTRDFLGLRAFSHRGFPNMAGLDQINSSSSYDHQQNHNQTSWQS
uniref:Putative zinc finger protein NUTCRACKER-like n=1 Tax=Davidia involucrata TaxID=16924 RepID=A0A5B6ZS98_DAVIN